MKFPAFFLRGLVLAFLLLPFFVVAQGDPPPPPPPPEGSTGESQSEFCFEDQTLGEYYCFSDPTFCSSEYTAFDGQGESLDCQSITDLPEGAETTHFANADQWNTYLNNLENLPSNPADPGTRDGATGDTPANPPEEYCFREFSIFSNAPYQCYNTLPPCQTAASEDWGFTQECTTKSEAVADDPSATFIDRDGADTLEESTESVPNDASCYLEISPLSPNQGKMVCYGQGFECMGTPTNDGACQTKSAWMTDPAAQGKEFVMEDLVFTSPNGSCFHSESSEYQGETYTDVWLCYDNQSECDLVKNRINSASQCVPATNAEGGAIIGGSPTTLGSNTTGETTDGNTDTGSEGETTESANESFGHEAHCYQSNVGGSYSCYESEEVCDIARGIDASPYTDCAKKTTLSGETFVDGGNFQVDGTLSGNDSQPTFESGDLEQTFYEDQQGALVQCKGPRCGFEEFMALLKRLVEFLLIYIAAPFAAIFFVYAGFLYMTSAGNMGKVSTAKSIFFWIVMGFIIALAAWLVIDVLLRGLQVKEDFNFLSKTESRQESPYV